MVARSAHRTVPQGFPFPTAKSFLLGGALLLVFVVFSPSRAQARMPMPVMKKCMLKKCMTKMNMMKMNMMRLMKNKAWVARVQRALDHQGAHIKVDGMCGIETVNALRAFQKAHHLRTTGMPDPATLKLLGVRLPAIQGSSSHH